LNLRSGLLVLALAGCAGAPRAGPAPLDPVGPEVGLTLPTLEGPELRIPDDLRGRVLLIDIWATWCQPCRRSLPAWQDLEKRLGAQGLDVLAVSIDDDAADVRGFVKDMGLDLRVLLDPGAGRTSAVLGFDRVPTVALVDRRGRLRRLLQGWGDDHPARIEAAVRRLLAEPPD
jgi:thiol-disulfide isomerase/thioredoxin